MSDGFWLRVLVVLLLLVPGARADVVHLTNGSTLRGEVVSEDAESVVLRTPRSLLTIPAADVAGIERETEADGLRGLAEDCLRHHRYARALEYLDAARKHSPDDPELLALLRQAYDGRIRGLTDKGRYGEAEDLARQAREGALLPEHLKLAEQELDRRRAEFDELRALAESALEVGRYEQALESYRKLLVLAPARRAELLPQLARTYLRYGDSLFREDDYGAAQRQYERVLRLDPDLLPQVQMKFIATVLSVVNRELEQAQGPLPSSRGLELTRQLQELIALDPDLPHTHLLMGLVYEHLRRPTLALSEYQQVLGETVPGASVRERGVAARQRAQRLVSQTPLEVDTAPQSEDWAQHEPGDWQVDHSDHFRLHHHNPRVSARLLAAAEYHLKRQAPLFGLSPETALPVTCDIFLYRDGEAYREATGRAAWSSAVSTFTASNGNPAELAIHTHQEAKLLGQTSVPHELGHLLLYRVTGYAHDVHLWIHEGVAVSQEPAFKVAYLVDEVSARRQAATAMPLEEVLRTTTYPGAEDVSEYYGLCYSLVQYLLSQGDFDRLPQFALDARTDLDRALQTHYGMTLSEFRSGWEEYLEDRLASLPAGPKRPE